MFHGGSCLPCSECTSISATGILHLFKRYQNSLLDGCQFIDDQTVNNKGACQNDSFKRGFRLDRVFVRWGSTVKQSNYSLKTFVQLRVLVSKLFRYCVNFVTST